MKLHSSAWWLAAASGVLQVVIFPTPDLHWLCWIAIAPLVAAVLGGRKGAGDQLWRPASPWQSFLLGWLAGFIWSVGSCYWIYSVMHGYGGLDAPVAFGVLLVFCIPLGAHMGVFTLLIGLLTTGAQPRSGLRRALVLTPFLWVAVEFGRTLFTGFPWNLLGTVQVDNISLSRIATSTGVYGMSFEIVLVNAGFAAAFLARRRSLRILLLSSLAAAVALQAGEFVRVPALPAPGTALLVQPNLKVMQRWTSESFRHTLAELRDRSLPPAPAASLGEPTPDLIVWPESPAPFFINDPEFHAAVTDVATRTHAYVIVGSIGVSTPSGAMQPQQVLNSASLVTPSGAWSARYDKIHLVPFGEYVPYKSLFSFAQQLTREVGDFVPGRQRSVFDLGRYRAGAFICYESIFPGEVRQFALNGAQVFVNLSNDEWFGHSAAPLQHLNQARMRAVENRRWLLRATNTGITASIDPYGRIIDQAPRGVLTALPAPFGIVSETTFYTRHGDWFAWLCVIISLAALVISAPWRQLRPRP